MTIEIWQIGGFAGIEQKLASADTGTFTRAATEELESLLARLSSWCAEHPESAGADRPQYRIDVKEPGGLARRLSVVDEGDPADVGLRLAHDILELLEREAK